MNLDFGQLAAALMPLLACCLFMWNTQICAPTVPVHITLCTLVVKRSLWQRQTCKLGKTERLSPSTQEMKRNHNFFLAMRLKKLRKTGSNMELQDPAIE